MTRYAAPQHTPRMRVALLRSTKILSVAAFLLLISLFAVVRPPAGAAANPIFATFQYVDNAISTALAPIQSAIASLQTQQTNQATQISNLQYATGKQLRVYDANGTEIGLLIDHGSNNTNSGTSDIIYSTALSRFIYLDPFRIANNFYRFENQTRALFQSSDCTGTPYETDYAHNVNDLLPYSPTTYYIFHDSEQPTTINIASQGTWDPSSNHLNCIPNVVSNVQAYQLYPVSLPFSTPVAFPLQYKYQ